VSLLIAWVAFPALLAALAYGCGLLVERIGGEPLPAALVAGVGLALIIVVARLLTALDATAELVAPLVVVLAVAGILASRGRPQRPPTRWEMIAAVATFAVFAVPILAAGEATLAGYRKLEDGATWLALTHHVLEHGTTLPASLEPSTYALVIQSRLGTGYPFGSFLPFGIGGQLLGHEIAWLLQPYIAFLAAMLAATIYALTSSVIASPVRRALVAVVSTQAALLFGYAMWGGVKEVAAAWLVALAAATASAAVRRGAGARAVLPASVAASATIACLGLGGIAWVGVPLLAALVVLAARAGWQAAATRAALFLVPCVPLVLLTLSHGDVTQTAGQVLTGQNELGTLRQPTSPLQLGGVWLGGDFRFSPEYPAATLALLVGVLAGALAGVWLLVRSRAIAPMLYLVGTATGCAAVAALGAPWIDSKAFAIASPVVVLLALCAGAAGTESGRRLAGRSLTAVVAAGVLASTALALGHVTLAPRDRLNELAEIDQRFAGAGPTLVVDREAYATRYLFRHLAAEGAADRNLMSRPIRLRSGARIEHGQSADVDQLHPASLRDFRLLVVRRSPLGSRPPGNFSLEWSGRWYDVWRRSAPAPIEHLSLNGPVGPAAKPGCAELRRFASRHRGARLLAAPARRPVVVSFSGSRLPAGWVEAASLPGAAVPEAGGIVRAAVTLRRDDTYEIALGGTVAGRVQVLVDGRLVASSRHRINNGPSYEPLAELRLSAGRHRLELHFDDGLLLGKAGRHFKVGPLAIVPRGGYPATKTLRARDYRSLCGQLLDWVEAIGAVGARPLASAPGSRAGGALPPRS
jgi:hypothetical protein